MILKINPQGTGRSNGRFLWPAPTGRYIKKCPTRLKMAIYSSKNVFQLSPEEWDFLDKGRFVETYNSKIKEKPAKQVFSNFKMTVFVDSEYTSKKGISIQAHCIFKILEEEHTLKFIAINSDYEKTLPIDVQTQFHASHNVHIFFTPFGDSDSPLISGINFYLKKLHHIDLQATNTICNISLYLFYSIKDLTHSFGWDNMVDIYQEKRGSLKRYRGLSGKFTNTINHSKGLTEYRVTVNDLFGIDAGGLASIAAGCGIDITTKNYLNDYKKADSMDKALIEKPLIFLEYGIFDASVLKEILDKKVLSFNQIMIDIFNIPQEALFTTLTIPLTLGSIVNQIWEKYLHYVVFKNNNAIRLALAKQGILELHNINYRDNLETFKRLKKITSLKEMENYVTTDFIKNAKSMSILKKGSMRHQLFSMGGIKAFTDNSQNTTKSILGFRTGGRTVNEIPTKYTCSIGGDIDINSAYGEELQKGKYPIGRPSLFFKTNNETNIVTLKKFLEKHEKDLINGLFKINVTGRFDEGFEQDLIYSKIVKENSFFERPEKFDPEDPESLLNPGEHVLLRKEIVNGVITQRVLQILQKTCSLQEMNQFYNLEVTSAAWWEENNRIDTIEEFSEILLADKGSYKIDLETGATVDNRTKKWFQIELKDFIEPLLTKRKKLKKLSATDPFAFAYQYSLKNIINTFYGDVTSIYFSMNNCIVSDIITASIRCSVWQISKALNTCQSITDGGIYSFLTVNYLKNNLSSLKKPSMTVLSNLLALQNHRSVKVAPISGYDWKKLFENNVSPEQFPPLDKIGMNHITKFWDAYDLDCPFNIEHKMKNLFIKASYTAKAHYFLITFNSETNQYDLLKRVIRGVSNFDGSENFIPNPMVLIMTKMLYGIDDVGKLNLTYNDSSLLSLNQYRKSLDKKGKSKSITYISSIGNGTIRPGDSIISERQFKLNNLNFFLYTTSDFLSRNNRYYKNTRYKQGNFKVSSYQKLFEKFLDKGIAFTFEQMITNNLGGNNSRNVIKH